MRFSLRGAEYPTRGEQYVAASPILAPLNDGDNSIEIASNGCGGTLRQPSAANSPVWEQQDGRRVNSTIKLHVKRPTDGCDCFT